MMAAGRAAELGKRVLLLEKNNDLGNKLKITGGGRCNVTNAEADLHRLLSNYGKAKDFLFSPFSRFGVKDVFNFFESRGLPLVTEARQRVFPSTQKAADVFRVLEKYTEKGKVVLKKGNPVTEIIVENKRVSGVICGGVKYTASNFVLATGGISAPKTGSTGDGFSWLAKLGHTVNKPNPSIVPLKVKESWVKKLSGVSLSFMKITFFQNGQKQFTRKGKILFTHFGLSAPLILNSAYLVRELLPYGPVDSLIDMYPDTNLGSLEKTVIKVFDKNKNKDLKNIIAEIVPDGMDPAVISLIGTDLASKKTHSVTREERKKIVHLLKAMPLTVTSLMGYDRAVISDGGVVLQEVDMRTMRSQLYENLYVIGDLLNINRPSGGFSLQLCWTTGYLAGDNAAKM